MKMNFLLRAMSPIVLVVFLFTIALPAYGQQEASYQVSAPSSVTRGDSFDLTIIPVNTTLSLNDITVSLPDGLSATKYPVSAMSNGGYSYRILTGPYSGTFNMVITIASSSGSPVTIVRAVSVQPTFFDTYGIWIVLGVVLLIDGLAMSSSRY